MGQLNRIALTGGEVHEVTEAKGLLEGIKAAADGIEWLWEVSGGLLETPPSVRFHASGSWGHNVMHELIAPAGPLATTIDRSTMARLRSAVAN